MSFQLPTTTTNSGTNFSFGLNTAPTATTVAPTPKPQTFSFGSTGGGDAGIPGVKPLSFDLTNVAAAPPPTLGSGLGLFSGTAASLAPTITSNTLATASTTTTAAAPGFGFGVTPLASTTSTAPALPTLTLPKTTAAPILGIGSGAPTLSTGGFANLSTVTKTTDSSAISKATQLSYSQLEEHINKWTLELEEQEKNFTDQATQINAWDKILISNNQKILELNDAVQKVKSDQQTLEQELEFIGTQHKELEESIIPLQKEFLKIPQVDVERSQRYLLVENLDTQLKQMSEDLKEIIDNLNESNKGQDNTDPIIQIGKILNAHMTSLQWIESSSANIVNKIEDITKMHDTYKRDSERSFRSAYYN